MMDLSRKAAMFYGSEYSDLKPTNSDYAFVGSLGGLYCLLLGCWRRETCAPRLQEKWSESNPTCGQCSITAFLAQDIFGGEVYGVPNSDGSFHCFNKVGDALFDLTSEQFDHPIEYRLDFPQKRETHFAKAEKKSRYETLRAALTQSRLTVRHSSSLPGAWCPNWSHGKSSISSRQAERRERDEL